MEGKRTGTPDSNLLMVILKEVRKTVSKKSLKYTTVDGHGNLSFSPGCF